MAKTDHTRLAVLHNEHQSALSELERYKLVVENVQDYAIFFLDKEGAILTWNKGAERTKGYTPDEIIGKNFSIFYTESDEAAGKPQRILELARRHGRVEDEDWRVRKDGSKFWADVIVTALKKDGEVIGFAKVTRDLTVRKEQEDTLRKANALLRKQKAELKKLNTSKDEFISLASHQLRTPATAVKQLLGMLVEGFYGDIPEHLLPILTKAYQSNEREIVIVNNLLKVAQLDAGKVTLALEPLRLDALLLDVVDEHQDPLRNRGQVVEVDAPEDLAKVRADPVHLRMALSNIVDNASKYSPTGGHISLSIECEDAEQLIHISDNGVGISPADQTKLFNKFTRIPNKLSDEVGGSGLGLYWAQKVIELHGGRISIKSAVNQGTTFTVHLPKGAS